VEKDTKRIRGEYKDIPISFYVQQYKEGDKKEITKNILLSPQISSGNISFSYQVKDTYTKEELWITQTTIQLNLNFRYKNVSLNLGETRDSSKNLNLTISLSANQSFISDGYQTDFTLTYIPIPGSLSLYINGVKLENGDTFTYYLPSQEPITYQVEFQLIDNILQVFFIDDSGKNPPPSGLSIYVTYQYLLPQTSYSKKDSVTVNYKWNKINTTFQYNFVEKDGSYSRIFSSSLYGELFPKFWSNLSYVTYVDENRRNLSLNISYRPEKFEFYSYYNYQESLIGVVENLSITGKYKSSSWELQGGYNEKKYNLTNYNLYVKNFNGNISFPLLKGQLGLSFFNEFREGSLVLKYLSSSYGISYSRDIIGISSKISLLKEIFSDNSFRWKNVWEVYPFAENTSKIFLENIYYQELNKFYSSWRIGAIINLNW